VERIAPDFFFELAINIPTGLASSEEKNLALFFFSEYISGELSPPD